MASTLPHAHPQHAPSFSLSNCLPVGNDQLLADVGVVAATAISDVYLNDVETGKQIPYFLHVID